MLIVIIIIIKNERRCVLTGGGESARGTISRLFSPPISHPCPVYFILEIPAGASKGKKRPKSPSPASLSDRTVILKRITYHKLNFLSSEDVSKVEMN